MGEEQGNGGSDGLFTPLFAALALGVILIVVGFDTESSGTVDAGLIFTTIALFAGAFSLKANGYVRLGMALAGAVVLANLAPAIMGLGAFSF